MPKKLQKRIEVADASSGGRKPYDVPGVKDSMRGNRRWTGEQKIGKARRNFILGGLNRASRQKKMLSHMRTQDRNICHY